MKIAYITAGAGNMICGNCLRDNNLARALLDLGHDVQLIPTYTPIRTDEVDVSLQRVFYGGINVYLQQKSAVFRNTPWFLDGLLDHPALLRWVSQFAVKTQPQDLAELTVSVLRGAAGPQKKELIKLIAWLKVLRPEVVHLTNSMLAGIAPEVKRELGCPVVCSLQGEDLFLSNLPSPYREQALAVLREMARHVDTFIAPSRDHAQAMAPLLGIEASQIRVVMPGLHLEDFRQRLARNPEEFVIGYLARVAPEKGLHLLVEAVHILRSRRKPGDPRCRLRAAGWLGEEARQYLDTVQAVSQAKGLGEDFEYLGTIDRERKMQFLQTLDVLSVPVSYRAPKGAYVLEALACGVPVVQPRSGVFPELIEATGGGLLFKPGNAEDLARAIESLIADRAAADQMGVQGRKVVHEKFHSRRTAQETVAVYEQITGKRAHHYGV
jgi:glycosyltransferase involved in cell wall biosynthesis